MWWQSFWLEVCRPDQFHRIQGQCVYLVHCLLLIQKMMWRCWSHISGWRRTKRMNMQKHSDIWSDLTPDLSRKSSWHFLTLPNTAFFGSVFYFSGTGCLPALQSQNKALQGCPDSTVALCNLSCFPRPWSKKKKTYGQMRKQISAKPRQLLNLCIFMFRCSTRKELNMVSVGKKRHAVMRRWLT